MIYYDDKNDKCNIILFFFLFVSHFKLKNPLIMKFPLVGRFAFFDR